jgi:hypothetical protein
MILGNVDKETYPNANKYRQVTVPTTTLQTVI